MHFALLLTIQTAFSQQPWDPFPLGQKTWWRTDQGTLELWYADSSDIRGVDDERRYFGRHDIEAPFGQTCFDLIFSVPSAATFLPLPDTYGPVFRVADNGDWYTIHNPNTPFFKPRALQGESWEFATLAANGTTIRMTCQSVGSMVHLGRTTAVKHFRVEPLGANGAVLTNHPLYGFEYVLSEQFGLLHLIAFPELLEGKTGFVHDMVALEKNGLQLGQSFTFDAFMGRYKAGNVYKWKLEESGYPNATKVEEWRRDSITAVQLTADKLTYTADRQMLRIQKRMVNGQTVTDSSNLTLPNIQRVFDRAELEAVIQGAPNWYARKKDGVLIQTKGLATADGAITLRGSDGPLLLSSDCEVSVIVDIARSFVVNNRCGVERISFSGITGDREEMLLGCRQGNQTEGDVTPLQTVSTKQPFQTFSLDFFPNPTKGHLFFTNPFASDDETPVVLQVFNMIGQQLISEQRQLANQDVDIAALPSGTYRILLRGQRWAAQGLVVKI